MTTMKNILISGGLASAAMLTAVSVNAAEIATVGNTKVKLGGYIKLDALWSSFDDQVDSGSAREFYVPRATPVSSSNANTYFDMHAKQTRIHLGTDSKVGGKTLKSYFEIDFMTQGIGSENITNGYAPELRHAFFSYDKWLFGQTWSTFMNVGALPESVDFIGNTDGTVFVRQAQVRYTKGPWQFSIENPETTTPTSTNSVAANDDNEWPDFVARYNLKHNDLSLALAGLLRQLTVQGVSVDDTATGYGLSATGKYMIGKNDIRFGLNIGGGLGRYLAINTSAGAAADANGQLEAIDSMGLFASYRHHWNDKYRSSFIYSMLDVDNNTNLVNIDGGTTKSTRSLRANIMYDWVKNLSLGGELTLANREVESGADGDLTRLQFMAMYKF
jgi:hypothetical protein